jgi:hypothetical protein
LRRLANGIFIFGPAVFTLVMVVGCRTINTGLVVFGFPALLIWHVALGYTHRDDPSYLVYAVFNLFVYLQLALAGFFDL